MSTVDESPVAATSWWARRYPRWNQPLVVAPSNFVAGPTLFDNGRLRIHRSALYAAAGSAAAASICGALAVYTGDARLIGFSVAVVWVFVAAIHHEAAHALTGRRHGVRVATCGVRGTGPYVIYGYPTGTRTPRAMFWSAAAGPASNLAVATLWATCWLVLGARWDTAAPMSIGLIAFAEFLLVPTNLIPVRGTDGDTLRRALRAARTPG